MLNNVKFFKTTRFLLESIILRLIFFLNSLLPINFVSIIGGNIFKFFGPISHSHKIALTNYRTIFEDLSEKEIKENIKKNWDQLGRTFFEFSILEKILDKKNNKIKINGLENIKQVIEKKENVIFFTIHQSNWEIILPLIDQLGISVGGIYRHINNKFIDKLVYKIRNNSINSKRSFYTSKGKESAKKIINAIKNNISVLVLIDQKDTAGDNVKFFNVTTKTQTGFLKIARKNNLKLIPIKNTRLNINNFLVEFFPPIKIKNNSKNEKESMLVIHKIIEKWILDNPNQWLWQHNRFS